MADDKAAFGVFPQIKPRRSKQDREAAKSFPLDVARGFVAGALGMPGDIESLARLPYELITGKESPTILPTSEDIEKRLPLRSDTPAARAATGLGQIGGGFYTGPLSGARAAVAVPKAVMQAGRDFVQAAGQPAVNVIKPKGGNFLTGSVERAVAPLKPRNDLLRQELQDNIKLGERFGDQGIVQNAKSELAKMDAVDQWIDRNLTNYIKKEMATPEDPVRLLIERRQAEVEGKYIKDQERAQRMADRAAAETDPRRQANLSRQAQQMRDEADLEREIGLAHLSHLPSGFGENSQLASYISASRESKGFPREGMAKTPSSKIWENLSDEAIVGARPSEISPASRNLNPWIEKLDPNESVYRTSQDIRRELGFDHIVDVLRQDLAAGRINPDQLSKISMEQAVRRTAEFDQDMAKKMREARIKITEGMPVHKEYPEGYKWIELAMPKLEALPEGSKFQKLPSGMTQVVDSSGAPLTVPAKDEEHALRLLAKERGYKTLEDALKYEGETMGHCVGGYCPDVLQGRSRIYSLRDAKGEPHVTVEVQPNQNFLRPLDFAQSAPPSLRKRIDEADAVKRVNTQAEYEELVRNSPEYQDYLSRTSPEKIIQIKGKQNKAPKEEYLPFVQDFVRGGKWSEVGDLRNTGLQKVEEGSTPGFQEWMRLKALGNEPKIPPGYYTPEELLQFGSESGLKETHPSVYKKWRENLGLPPEEGMKRGGSVHISDNADAQMMEMMDKKMAGGGLLKALKGVQKALPQAEREANLQKLLEPSKVKERLYHGTMASEGGKGQEAIRRLKPSKEGALGSGVYLTPQSEFASTYAGFPARSQLERDIATGSDFAKESAGQLLDRMNRGAIESHEIGGNMLPVYAQLKNPLILEGKGDPMIEALVKLGVDEATAGKMVERAYETKGYIGREVESRARAAGYDGLMRYHDGNLSEVVSYNPNAIKSATGNVGTYDVTSPDLSKAKGGKVSFSDNLDAMMMDVEDRKMGVGGLLRRGAKAAKSEPALPLELPRAPAKTKEEIRPVAQRMAQQMTGEFVRPNPKKSINPAGKSLKQFQMEKELTHDIRPAEGVTLSPQQVADIEKQLGMLKIGVSGDTTIADQVLYRAGPYQLDLPSPQHGGPLYALGGEGAWASNNPTAATFQKRVQELSRAYGDAPTLGQFVAMGPEGSNFALHLADANLRAIDLSKMTKSQIEQANDIIRQGTAKSGPRPGFPGIEDKESAYLHFAFDPELRKAFNAMMNKPDYTSKLNLPDGRVILHAVTEPELRNTEILTSGRSQMMLDPSVAPEGLALSKHPTYSHVIPKVPGSEVSRTKYPIPAELEFPDVQAYIRENVPKKSHTRMYQTATPRQIIDQQHIDEMKMYEELMKEYTGKKKGGAVEKPDNGLIKVTKKRKAKA